MFYSKCIHKRKLESHNQKTLSLGNRWLLILVLSFVSPLFLLLIFMRLSIVLYWNCNFFLHSYLAVLYLLSLPDTHCPFFFLPIVYIHLIRAALASQSIKTIHLHLTSRTCPHYRIGPISGKRTGFIQVQVLWPFSVFHHASRLNSLH